MSPGPVPLAPPGEAKVEAELWIVLASTSREGLGEPSETRLREHPDLL